MFMRRVPLFPVAAVVAVVLSSVGFMTGPEDRTALPEHFHSDAFRSA